MDFWPLANVIVNGVAVIIATLSLFASYKSKKLWVLPLSIKMEIVSF